jgi:serralysin
MGASSRGGDDTLIGGASSVNFLFGDAAFMGDGAHGGNDTLTGGDNSVNWLFGDASVMADNAVAGNDTLISGTGTDYMWGDTGEIDGLVTTGADTFVFKPGSGNDAIFDFRHVDGDKVDVSAYGFTDISQLSISGFDDGNNGALIDFGGGNTVVLCGVDPSTLVAADFKFA